MRKLIVLSAALAALAVPSVAAAQEPAASSKPKRFLVSVSGPMKVDPGWTVDVDVVELRRVPDTASQLATYRAKASRLIRHDGLSAVVSDAPESLRAKRRDLVAHERVLETLTAARVRGGGGIHGDKVAFGENPALHVAE
jgi:hypothetical protein